MFPNKLFNNYVCKRIITEYFYGISNYSFFGVLKPLEPTLIKNL